MDFKNDRAAGARSCGAVVGGAPLSGPAREIESNDFCSSFAAPDAAFPAAASSIVLVRKEKIVGVPSCVIFAGSASSLDGRMLRNVSFQLQ